MILPRFLLSGVRNCKVKCRIITVYNNDYTTLFSNTAISQDAFLQQRSEQASLFSIFLYDVRNAAPLFNESFFFMMEVLFVETWHWSSSFQSSRLMSSPFSKRFTSSNMIFFSSLGRSCNGVCSFEGRQGTTAERISSKTHILSVRADGQWQQTMAMLPGRMRTFCTQWNDTIVNRCYK